MFGKQVQPEMALGHMIVEGLQLDDAVLAQLQSRADQNRRSIDDEVRAIIMDAVRTSPKSDDEKRLQDREARIEAMREFAEWSAAHLAKLEPLPSGTIVSWIREDRDSR